MQRRKFLQHSALLSVSCLLPGAGRATTTFPDRPISLLVPYSAGGPTDTHIRAIAAAASTSLGVTVIVENRPGANGTNAARSLPRAAPDGYSLGILPAGVYREPHLTRMPFDPTTSFSYIAMLSDYAFGLAVRADAPWKTWQDFATDARHAKEGLNIGTPGSLSTPNIVMDEIGQTAGLKLNLIPFKGDTEIATALLGGHIDAAPLSGIAVPHIATGKMRYLVMLTSKRIARYPDLPTLREAGVDNAIDSPYGVAGPAGMDPAKTAALSAIFQTALNSPESRKVMDMLNQQPNYMDPTTYHDYALRTFQQEGTRIARLRERGLVS